MYIDVYMYVCVYVYIHTHTNTHTYIYIYITCIHAYIRRFTVLLHDFSHEVGLIHPVYATPTHICMFSRAHTQMHTSGASKYFCMISDMKLGSYIL